MQIENKVAYYRKRRGMTVRQLSKASGIAKSTISAIENGVEIPMLDTALLICMALKVDPEEVFALKQDR